MMIHKIEPHKYYPEFRSQDPKPSDYLLLFDGEKVYLPSHTENSDVTDTSAGAGISEHPQEMCIRDRGISVIDALQFHRVLFHELCGVCQNFLVIEEVTAV